MLTHIYGVDIDLQAVEVSKLSLLLKVLEGENADMLAAQMSLFHMRALPDLGQNVKCGNSLITHDFYEQQQKALFSEDARLKINAFNWEDEFGFLFDVVIGNPPYGGDYTGAERILFQNKYTYKRGKPETYLFFIEQGFRLLKPGGFLGFIVPNAWLTNFYGLQIRALLAEQSSIYEVADLEPVKAFKAATVDTCIVILRNEMPTEKSKIVISRAGRDRALRPEFEVKQNQWKRDHEKIFNVYATEADLKIMAKMEHARRRLESITEYSQGVIPYKTRAEGESNPYIADRPNGPEWKPLFESASQLEQYWTSRPRAFIRYGRWLWCARDPKYFDQPKILFHRLRKKLSRQLIGALDTSGAVNRHALSNLILLQGHEEEELWAALALFNSELVNWWFVKRYGPLMEVGGFKVQGIPLPEEWARLWPTLAVKAKGITEALLAAVVAKDEHTRAVLNRTAQGQRKAVEKLLAKSYGLTEDEVRHTVWSFQELVERTRSETLLEDYEEVAS